MNKKPYKQVEEQIKAAAREWEPAFDEQAWLRMEQMLEKDDDRRRPFAWWLLGALLMMGIATVCYFGFHKNDAQKNIALHTTTQTNNLEKQKNSATKLPLTVNKTFANPPSTLLSIDSIKKITVNKNNISKGQHRSNVQSKNPLFKNYNHLTEVLLITAPKATEKNKGKEEVAMDNNLQEEPQNNDKASGSNKNNIFKIDSLATPKEKMAKMEEPTKNVSGDSTQKSKTLKAKERLSKFYFTVGAGVEGNAANFPGTNKFNMRTGFAAGYYFTKKMSVQAGIYEGSKKYIAKKNDYKAKPGSYWSTVDITKVDANCKVLEIPVSVRMDFNEKKNITGFAGIGLSSFILSSEKYNYNYTYNNTPYQGKASYTGNRNWFSILRLYGGFEKKMTNNFSLGIQPGLAIPLAGVGEGSVKLFSSELLFTIKYRPSKK
ncbi:MAG: hypothetical protein JSU03_12835 [Bacteroidetes bacterium]|nr:hypothetical protein [Bacteroidota bacterium]